MFKVLIEKWKYSRHPYHKMSKLIRLVAGIAKDEGFKATSAELYIMAAKLEIVAQDEHKNNS